MNSHSIPILAFSICCTLALGLLEPAAAEPTLQFRWLQTDSKTADALVNAIKGNKLAVDVFGAKIDEQVRSGKITELAFINKKFISGERFVLSPKTGKMPLGIEAVASVRENGSLVDLRYVMEWTPKVPGGTGLLKMNSGMTISNRFYHLCGRWADARTGFLLLACASGLAVPAPTPDGPLDRAGNPAIASHIDTEWRETTAADLAKVTQAPPESRAKALVWLRGRSTQIASTSGIGLLGEKSKLEYLWGGKSDMELAADIVKNPEKAAKEPPPRPGVTFQWEPNIIEDDKALGGITTTDSIEEIEAKVNHQILSQTLDLRFAATYVPIKARDESAEIQFEFWGKLSSGVMEFVSAKTPSKEPGPIVVLIFTPWYDIIR